MKKRILSIVMALAMMLSLMPTAFAAERDKAGLVSIDTLVEAEDGTYDANSEHVTYTYDDTKKCAHSKQDSEGHYLEGKLSWVKTVTFSGISFSELTDNSEDMAKLKSVIMNGRRTDTSDQFKDSIEVTFKNCSFNQETATLQVYKIMPCNVTKYTFVNCTFDQKAAGQYAITLNASETGVDSRAISYEIIDSVINSAGRGINITAGTESESLGSYMPSIVIKGNNFTLPAASDSNMAIQIAGNWDSANLTADSDPLLTVEQNKIKAYAAVRVNDTMKNNTTDSAKYMVRFADNVLAEGTKGAITKPSDTNETTNAIAAYYNARLMGPVAQIGETTYDTLAGAVGAAKDGETVTLLRDTELTADLTLSYSGGLDAASHTLETNGHKVYVPSGKSITLQAASGGIQNSTSAPSKTDLKSMLVVEAGGKLTIKSGTYSTKAAQLILSNGEVVIESGTFICDAADVEANKVLDNTAAFNISGASAKLTFKSGTLTADVGTENNYMLYGIFAQGGASVTLGEQGGAGPVVRSIYAPVGLNNMTSAPAVKVEIFGGEYHSRINAPENFQKFNGVLYLSGDSTVTIHDGIFTAETKTDYNHVISVPYSNAKVNLTINNGKFAAQGDVFYKGTQTGGSGSGEPVFSVTGGLFSSDPSDYCAEGMTGVTNTDSATNADYPYAVGKKNADAKPAVVEAATVPANTPDNASQAAKDVAGQMTGGAGVEQDTVLEGAIKDAANSNKIEGNTTLADGKTVTSALNAAIGNDSSVQDEEVAIVYQPYVDVTVTDAVKSGEKVTSFTADLTPMYRVVATTQTVVNSNDEIKVSGEVEADANAVLVKSGEELNGLADRQYEVKLALPTDFASAGEKLCIKHEKNGSVEYYTGTVSDDSKFVTFITNGFSPFTVYAASESAASIGENIYPTLQAAVDAVENDGTIKLLKDGETATVNRTVKFTVEPDNKTYTINLGSNCTDRDTNNKDIFDVVYTAPSGGSSGSSYTVNVEDSKNGTVTASHKSASKNTTVTLTVKADKGYELDELTVTDKNGKEIKLTDKGNGKYTFTMPAGKVDVKATFAKIVEAPAYSDVSASAWYADAVAYVTDKGMMEGDSGKFMPLDKLTRSQMTQVLFNLEGKKSVNYALTFGDMNGTEWYAEAVRWAASEQIVNGYDNGNFGPNDPITREQLVTVLYRYAQYKGLDTATTEENLTSFADAAQVSGYAVSAMNWAVGAGVINGTDSGLAPKATATRAEVAQILMNFDQKF